jgi:cytochrome oxidase Cu insertion factor (SCO1/SenC/PrrC family)
MSETTQQRRSQLKLILLLLVFLLPVILAYVMHLNPQWLPKSTKNYGEMYTPVVSLNKFILRTQADKTFSLDDLRGKWSLVYIGAQSCDTACQQTLFKARDSRWAQGTEALRVNYYYLVTADKFTGDQAGLLKANPGLIMLHGEAAQRDGVIQQFRFDKAQQPGTDNQLYVVDPNGNILLHYPYGFKDIGLMEDLKHLLKWSQIG